MKLHNKNAVCEFLIQNLSTDLVEGLNILSKIKVPIHDKRSFESGIEADSAHDKYKKNLIQAFTPEDFPILSVQSAFEKYWAKFPAPLPFPFPPIDLPDFRLRPSACDVYSHTPGWTPSDADCACRAFQEAIREGLNSWQATVIGYFAGTKHHKTGSCEV